MFKVTLAAALLVAGTSAAARTTVDAAHVEAHEAFLAGPMLRGRGSLTRDEALAAAYVAAQFQSYGLQHAPGMDGYIQTAPVLRQNLASAPVLLANGKPIAGATLISGSGGMFGGKVAVLGHVGKDAHADALVVPPDADRAEMYRTAAALDVRLIIVPEDDATRRSHQAAGGRPRLPVFFPDDAPRLRPAFVSLPADAMAPLLRDGATAVLSVPFELEHASTSNAIAYLPGTDPRAGVILLSAHLDHLGVALDGQVFAGANDDASGVVALLELARTLADGKRPRRGILFVAYGSEELGGFGSRWFADHAPIPLDRITANIEFEMIGAREPKLGHGKLMMTGYERSNLGATLAAHGALIGADPYPEEHFFQRSDNYSLALRGVVAHTISGWGTVPSYHTPDDSVENLDIDYMVEAIGSLVGPVRWLADSRFAPSWNPGGQPKEQE